MNGDGARLPAARLPPSALTLFQRQALGPRKALTESPLVSAMPAQVRNTKTQRLNLIVQRLGTGDDGPRILPTAILGSFQLPFVFG